jgi:hypothetical protein
VLEEEAGADRLVLLLEEKGGTQGAESLLQEEVGTGEIVNAAASRVLEG